LYVLSIAIGRVPLLACPAVQTEEDCCGHDGAWPSRSLEKMRAKRSHVAP